MKTIVILTDFTEEAFRAAEYACELAGCLNVKKIILYNAYLPVIAHGGGYTDAAAITVDDQELHMESMESLALLHDRLKPLVGKEVSFELEAQNSGLEGLAEWIDTHKKRVGTGLLVMGVSHKSGIDKLMMGSATREVLNKNEWPVLIVPETTLIGRGFKKIVFASDLREVENIPGSELTELLTALPAELHVIHIEEGPKDELSPERENAVVKLQEMLDEYDPVINYRNGDKVDEEILSFAQQEKASLIITVHKKQGFWSRLFGESITRKLAEKTNVPLLSLPGLK